MVRHLTTTKESHHILKARRVRCLQKAAYKSASKHQAITPVNGQGKIQRLGGRTCCSKEPVSRTLAQRIKAVFAGLRAADQFVILKPRLKNLQGQQFSELPQSPHDASECLCQDLPDLSASLATLFAAYAAFGVEANTDLRGR